MDSRKKETAIIWGLILAASIALMIAVTGCMLTPLTVDRVESQACFDYQHYNEVYQRTSCWHRWDSCVDMELYVRRSPHVYRVTKLCQWY